jgi:SOS-response transcriptional repressor LexA
VAAAYVTLARALSATAAGLWHNHQRASRKPVPPFPPSLRLNETQARGLPCLCADEAGNIYSACLSVECTKSPRREEKAQLTNETRTLRRNAAWHHDEVPFPVLVRTQNNIPISNHTYINISFTCNVQVLQDARHFSLRLKGP